MSLIRYNAINQFVANNPEFADADTGSIPSLFDPFIEGYQHIDLLKLILFYNEDMGIVAGSWVPDVKGAVQNWLMIV